MMTHNWASEETRQRVVDVARSWIGTPFRHRAAVKGAGVDCVTLMGETFLEAGLVAEYQFPPYSLDYSKHQSRSILRGFLDAHPCFQLLPTGTPARAGDVACFKVGKTEHHAGLMVDGLVFVHSVSPQGVITSRLDDSTYSERLSCLYRPLEVSPS